jgi:hypothetical protein
MSEAARKHGLVQSTIRSWRSLHPEFDAQYARAITERAEVFFERGNDIAMTITDGEGAQIARVQLDWLKWAACKLAPKTYGDKMQHTGDGGGAIQIVSTIPRPPKEEE